MRRSPTQTKVIKFTLLSWGPLFDTDTFLANVNSCSCSLYVVVRPSVCLSSVTLVHLMHESIVFCSTCTMSSYRKFTFAISSPDEFLVSINSGPRNLASRHEKHSSLVWCKCLRRYLTLTLLRNAGYKTLGYDVRVRNV